MPLWRRNSRSREAGSESDNSICQSPGDPVVSLVVSLDAENSEKTEDYLVIELHPGQFSALMLNNQSMFQNQYTFLMDEKDEIDQFQPEYDL